MDFNFSLIKNVLGLTEEENLIYRPAIYSSPMELTATLGMKPYYKYIKFNVDELDLTYGKDAADKNLEFLTGFIHACRNNHKEYKGYEVIDYLNKS